MNIKIKVIISTVVVLALGMVAQMYQLESSYRTSLQEASRQSLDSVRGSFAQLEQSDIRMLRAVGDALKARADIAAAYKARDREKLYALTMPLYNQLKANYGITHWNFIDAPPNAVVFARMSKPDLVGDDVKRVTYLDAVKSGKLGVGREVGKTGFVLRTVTPVVVDGETIGYQEVGEDIDRFFDLIKRQTGSEVALVMDKQVMKEADWASTCKAKNVRNNWNDDPRSVVVSNTTADAKAMTEGGVTTAAGAEGAVLGSFDQEGKTLQRSVFSVADAGGKLVGSVYVLKDVTAAVAAIKAHRVRMIVIVVVQAIVVCLLLAFLLYRLVFARLDRMIDKVTRVVGGDSTVETKETDEVGRFESQVIGILRGMMSMMTS
jgi:methyl-accepting chemotaxis protein